MSNEIMITDPNTGGVKGRKDERFDLFPWDALEEVARVYAVGARKYADDNWMRGYAWRLSFGALIRHVSHTMCGEDRDPETGCLHLAHAAWHCLTLITFLMRGLGTDDRKPPKLRAAPKCPPDSVPPLAPSILAPIEGRAGSADCTCCPSSNERAPG